MNLQLAICIEFSYAFDMIQRAVAKKLLQFVRQYPVEADDVAEEFDLFLQERALGELDVKAITL